MPFVLTRLWIVLSTPVAPDFPCHRTRVETRIRPTMEVFFFTVRQPCTRQQEFTKDRSTDAFVVVLSLSLSLSLPASLLTNTKNWNLMVNFLPMIRIYEYNYD